MTAIFKKEFKSYFTGVTGYVFYAIMFFFLGIFVKGVNLVGLYPNFEYTLGNLTLVLVFALPLLTMRSFAEERRSGTDTLLYSLPVGSVGVVFAKYAAMLCVWGIFCVCTLAVPLVLSAFGSVYMPTTLTGLLGFFLLGAALIAAGMFVSSLTESSVIAATIGIGGFLALYLMSDIASLVPSDALTSFVCFAVCAFAIGVLVFCLTRSRGIAAAVFLLCMAGVTVGAVLSSSGFEGAFGTFLSAFAIFDSFSGFANGTLDVGAAAYLASFAATFVFLTVCSFDRRRWN